MHSDDDDDDDDNETQVTEHLTSDEDDVFASGDAQDEDNGNPQQRLAAARLAHHVTRDDGTPRYALKRLRADCNVALVNDAICDLTCEAMFLARLTHHSNIITLRGTVGSPGTASFMLIFDRLSDHLAGQVRTWQKEWQRCRGKALLGLWQRDTAGLQALYAERLLAAFDIARALRHLHRHKILYRDIKVRLHFVFVGVTYGYDTNTYI